MTDLEAQEAQQIENLQRKDVHPFEEAQGYRTLLGFEGLTTPLKNLLPESENARTTWPNYVVHYITVLILYICLCREWVSQELAVIRIRLEFDLEE